MWLNSSRFLLVCSKCLRFLIRFLLSFHSPQKNSLYKFTLQTHTLNLLTYSILSFSLSITDVRLLGPISIIRKKSSCQSAHRLSNCGVSLPCTQRNSSRSYLKVRYDYSYDLLVVCGMRYWIIWSTVYV